MTIKTVLMLLVALPNSTNIIVHHRQQQALAIQGDTNGSGSSNFSFDFRTPTTNLACGQAVEGLVELNSDLDCSGDGLIVGAGGTTIRLNRHTIRGPGPDSSKVGISVGEYDGVRIEGPGTIEQYQAAVLASGAKGTSITSLSLTGNQIAIFSTDTDGLQAMQNTITKNSIGVASHSSTGLQLTENLVSGNQLAGITFVATDDSLLSKNNILESENGIFTDAESSGNRIDSNNILRNTVDLNNANGLDININQNSYSYNNCEISNPSRLCTTAINTLQPPPQLQPPPLPSYPRLNWIQLCSWLDNVLVSPCNQLVNRDNTLTYEGQRAYVCIQNGIFLAGGGAVLLNLPPQEIIATLRELATITGCDDIVDWRPVDNLLYIIRLFS